MSSTFPIPLSASTSTADLKLFIKIQYISKSQIFGFHHPMQGECNRIDDKILMCKIKNHFEIKEKTVIETKKQT